jgi:hypothetical protein
MQLKDGDKVTSCAIALGGAREFNAAVGRMATFEDAIVFAA